MQIVGSNVVEAVFSKLLSTRLIKVECSNVLGSLCSNIVQTVCSNVEKCSAGSV